MRNWVFALVTMTAFTSPHTAFANNCGGVCNEGESDEEILGDCFYFMLEPCYFDLWS